MSSAEVVIGALRVNGSSSQTGKTYLDIFRDLSVTSQTLIGKPFFSLRNPLPNNFYMGPSNLLYIFTFLVCLMGKKNKVNHWNVM